MKKNTAIFTAAAIILSLLLSSCSAVYNEDAPPPGIPHDSAPSNSAPSVSSPIPPGTPAPGGYQPPGQSTQAPSESYDPSGESYLVIDENQQILTDRDSTLTFSLKVDTASYNNVQRFLESGSLPPRDAVRTEELINYFSYDTDFLFRSEPFSIYAEVAPSPFNTQQLLAFVRVKAMDIEKRYLPRSNLTFLIDTSGSMSSHDKLPLLKESFALLVETLSEDDVVSIVTYAGSSRVVLDSVPGADKTRIMNAINGLQAAGSTAGGEGIQTAYALAEKNLISGANNRIILATDGDFNVGVSTNEELSNLVKSKSDSGVYLSILGFGMGNIRDDLMETLSKDGNGNYSYINSLSTAQKVLVDELTGNLFTIADDVKAQIEFNPDNVKSFRLIGYENRMMNYEDFADDSKDAGEIGAGTDLVIMFEIELVNSSSSGLKYQSSPVQASPNPGSQYPEELFEVRIRYKDPGQSYSKLITFPVKFMNIRDYGSSDFNFACSVAAFSDLLRNSQYSDRVAPGAIFAIAGDSLGRDVGGYRAEFLTMLNQYGAIAG